MKECGWNPDAQIHSFLELSGNNIEIKNNIIKIDGNEYLFEKDYDIVYIYPDHYCVFEINLKKESIMLYRPAILEENQCVEIVKNELFSRIIEKIGQ